MPSVGCCGLKASRRTFHRRGASAQKALSRVALSSIGFWFLKQVGVSGEERSRGSELWFVERVFEASRGIFMHALMSEKCVFSHSHQHPSCRLLGILQLLKTLVTDPNEWSITVIQSGSDKAWISFSGTARVRADRSSEIL